MNKKILLGLGASLLSALPLVAIVSCADSTTNTKDIDSELSKFAVSIKTKQSWMSSYAVVTELNDEILAQANDEIYTLNYISNVPKLDDDFDYKIINAKINDLDPTTIDVNINIFNKRITSLTGNVILKITGFQAIDSEADKFLNQQTIKPEMSASSAAGIVNQANTPEDKKIALASFSSIPELTNGYNFNVSYAIVDSSNELSLTVMINIFREDDISINKTVIYAIHGFSSPYDAITLADQVKLFENPINTYRIGVDTLEAIEEINNASTITKLAVLQSFVNLPMLSERFALEVISANEIIDNMEAINVQIRIFELLDESNEEYVDFKVEGFECVNIIKLNDEVLKFTPATTKLPNLSSLSAAKQWIMHNDDENERFHNLELIVDVPLLAKGFSLKVLDANVDNDDKTIVNVDLLIFSTRHLELSRAFTYKISGFKISDIDYEAEKFVDRQTTSTMTS
ncbi:MAG: hypothetical protein ACRC63_01255, partial [Metamycoplasmataceae bacterium]